MCAIFLFRLLILIGKFHFIWNKKSPPKFNLYLKRVIRKKKLLLGDNIFFPKYAFIQVAKTLLKHFKIGK